MPLRFPESRKPGVQNVPFAFQERKGLADLVRRYYERQIITIRETQALLDLMNVRPESPPLQSAG